MGRFLFFPIILGGLPLGIHKEKKRRIGIFNSEMPIGALHKQKFQAFANERLWMQCAFWLYYQNLAKSLDSYYGV